MIKQYYAKFLIIAAVIGLCIWQIYPPQKKIKRLESAGWCSGGFRSGGRQNKMSI